MPSSEINEMMIVGQQLKGSEGQSSRDVYPTLNYFRTEDITSNVPFLS
jgi:hypothetical protein